jgi:hypothetical protein
MGSTNWTTSSRCNTELSVLLHLDGAGQHAWGMNLRKLRERAVLLTDSLLEGAEQRKLDRQHRARSLSPSQVRTPIRTSRRTPYLRSPSSMSR